MSRRAIDAITEQVIALESQESALRQAAVHANLLLDALDSERVASTYFRLDLPFSLQRYTASLQQLEFSSLDLLINSKVECLQNKKSRIN